VIAALEEGGLWLLESACTASPTKDQGRRAGRAGSLKGHSGCATSAGSWMGRRPCCRAAREMEDCWPSGVALRGRLQTTPSCARLTVEGGERRGEDARWRCQVGIGKASASESPLKCRKSTDGIETATTGRSQDEPSGNSPTGQVVPGR
jgi:hypothetical protein